MGTNNYVKVLGRVRLQTGKPGAIVRHQEIPFDDTNVEDSLRAKAEAEEFCAAYQRDSLISVTSLYHDCQAFGDSANLVGEFVDFEN
jgi:hypothetical protein